MNPLLPYLIVLFVAATAWTIAMIKNKQRNGPYPLGLMGAWISAVVLAAFWQAEAVPWLWHFLQGVLLLWLGAIVLLVIALVSISGVKRPGRRFYLCCAVLSIVVNLAAGLHFLWIATVSPGGV